jgi:hypothetical protein
MPTVKNIVLACGGVAAIVEAAQRDGKRLTGSAVRYWYAKGIPRRWYALVSELSGYDVATIHGANMTIESAPSRVSSSACARVGA